MLSTKHKLYLSRLRINQKIGLKIINLTKGALRTEGQKLRNNSAHNSYVIGQDLALLRIFIRRI